MLHKLFLQGSSKAATSARAYLAQYHDWLLTVPGAREIVEKIDQGTAFPTPSLPAIVRAVVEDQVRINPPTVKVEPGVTFTFTGCILIGETIMAEKSFSSAMKAQDWIDRRLTSDEYGPGASGKISLPKGAPLLVTIDDAHRRRFGRRPGMGGAITKTNKNDGRWVPKNVQSKATFSGG